MDAVLCKKGHSSRFHKLACVKKDCLKCKNHQSLICKLLRPVIDIAADKEITWNHWEYVEVKMKKNGVNVTVKKRTLVPKVGKMLDLIQELTHDFEMPIQRPIVSKSTCSQHSGSKCSMTT